MFEVFALRLFECSTTRANDSRASSAHAIAAAISQAMCRQGVSHGLCVATLRKPCGNPHRFPAPAPAHSHPGHRDWRRAPALTRAGRRPSAQDCPTDVDAARAISDLRAAADAALVDWASLVGSSPVWQEAACGPLQALRGEARAPGGAREAVWGRRPGSRCRRLVRTHPFGCNTPSAEHLWQQRGCPFVMAWRGYFVKKVS